MAKHFKQCPCCSFVWSKQDDFLSDSNIEILGDPVFFQKKKTGLFFFNHKTCQTSLTIHASGFANLCKGTSETSTRTPAQCLNLKSMEDCFLGCDCSKLREIGRLIRNWPKRTTASA